MSSKIYFVMIITLLSIGGLAAIVDAQSVLGVSPANINFKNVLRGGYAERYITITLDNEKPISINLSTRGDIAKWINFTVAKHEVSKNSPLRALVSISPPSDIPNGNYTGVVTIETGSLSDDGQEGHATGAIKTVLEVFVTVEIIDLEIKECVADSFEVVSVEKGDDLNFEVKVENGGNVRMRPEIHLDIWDQEQTNIVKTQSVFGKEILPTRVESISVRIDSDDLEVGQYWVDFSVLDCYASDVLTFDIYEPGTLRASGSLLGISVPVYTKVKETMSIIPVFKNTGEKEVAAQFKGSIVKDGKIVRLLTSDSLSVEINELANLTLFYTPEEEGEYLVSGRVFYDKKRTYELGAKFNALSEKINWKLILLYFFYFVLITAAIVLFLKIRKERRKYMQKINFFGRGI